MERLDRFDPEDDCWREILVPYKRAGPAQIACSRIDFAQWLKSVRIRHRRLAECLSLGNKTRQAARTFKVSAGWISQIRKELAANWQRLIGDDPGPAAANAA